MAEQDRPSGGDQFADRRAKLQRLRDAPGLEPYGRRVDGLVALDDARALYQPDLADEQRPAACVAGRVVLHRDIGRLVFMTLRDAGGDLQIAVSRRAVEPACFDLAKRTDLGDVVVARGRMGATRTGEVTLWAEPIRDDLPSYEMAAKCLVPPPEKWKGLQDAELRYRHRYVDMFANPDVVRTFALRSRIVSAMRRFMDERGFLEVETPMLQPVAGGAAARPFVTHHNALDADLYLRIAPELYLKRLLVGGLPRVYEINRNFRNEGIDRQHNPEFTSMEVYQAFGDYGTMMDLAESLIRHLALMVEPSGVITWGDTAIDYARPFRRVTYAQRFEAVCGFGLGDVARARARARELGLPEAGIDDWLVLDALFEATAEADLVQPTFVVDYPAAISPLTRPRSDQPELCERWDLFIGAMEIGPAYTELNDPDVQEQKFREQLAGADLEDSTFRSLDADFLHALRVGMPPAGGMGLGVDRLVMLLSGARSVRDVIMFPLLRPESEEERHEGTKARRHEGQEEGR